MLSGGTLTIENFTSVCNLNTQGESKVIIENELRS